MNCKGTDGTWATYMKQWASGTNWWLSRKARRRASAQHRASRLWPGSSGHFNDRLPSGKFLFGCMKTATGPKGLFHLWKNDTGFAATFAAAQTTIMTGAGTSYLLDTVRRSTCVFFAVNMASGALAAAGIFTTVYPLDHARHRLCIHVCGGTGAGNVQRDPSPAAFTTQSAGPGRRHVGVTPLCLAPR